MTDRDPATHRHLRVLGEGRCSVVLALTPFWAWSNYLSCAEVEAFDGHESVALRIHKLPQTSVMEPTVQRALEPYIGVSVWIVAAQAFKDALSEAWRLLSNKELRKLRPETVVNSQFLQAFVHNAASLMLLQDFTSLIGDHKGVLSDRNISGTLLSSTTFEVKPKAAWREPLYSAARFFRIVNDEASAAVGKEVEFSCHMHRRKLIQCRFSQMQVWKEFRKRQATHTNNPELSGAAPRYCPNDLLIGASAAEKAGALTALSLHPENNLRCMNELTYVADDATQASSVATFISDASAALTRFDVCDKIASLQLGIGNDRHLPELLDVELLHHWMRCEREGGYRFELLQRSQWDNERHCACKTGGVLPSPACEPTTTGDWITPPFSLSVALDSFYIATTAKDLSLMITVERWQSGDVASHDGDRDDAQQVSVISDQAVAFRVSASEVVKCRVGVVDIDCKRHKPVDHYLSQDADICAVVDNLSSTPHPPSNPSPAPFHSA
jgi:hypothetical protein